jgi:hypothetical protein
MSEDGLLTLRNSLVEADIPDGGSQRQERFIFTDPLEARARNDRASRPIHGLVSDAAFVAPSQHVKLRQHRSGEPTVRGHLASEPAEALQQIVNIRSVRKDTAGDLSLLKNIFLAKWFTNKARS